MHQWNGFTIGQLSLHDLGVPIFKGKANHYMFDDMKNSIVNKLEGWKGRLLSIGGMLTLFKFVIASIPMHITALLKPPMAVLDFIQRRMKSLCRDKRSISGFPNIGFTKRKCKEGWV